MKTHRLSLLKPSPDPEAILHICLRSDLPIPAVRAHLRCPPPLSYFPTFSLSFRLALILAAVSLFTFSNPIAAAEKAPKKKERPGEDIFKDLVIPYLKIDVTPAAYTSLRSSPRRYTQATIHEGDITYTNVAIRLKGGPGSFRGVDDNPAFTLNFARFAEDQRFHGLKKVHLNNSVQDRGFMSEKISRELFDAAGVPTPQAGNAMVEFNDRVGMHVVIEGIGKQFLKRYFKDTSGNIYDGHSGSDVIDGRFLPVNSGDNPRDQSRLWALARAAREPDLDARLAALEKTLDVDRFITFMCMESILCHWDGYTQARNNFRMYHDKDTNRMIFIPQGMDQIVGQQGQGIYMNARGLIAQAVLEIPVCRQRYRQRMSQLITNVCDSKRIAARIREIGGKIEEAMAKVDQASATRHRSSVTRLIGGFQQRIGTIEGILMPKSAIAASKSPSQPRTNAIPPLDAKNWRTQTDLGTPTITRELDPDGHTRFHITAQDRAGGSWRNTVMLDSGEYRVVGLVKTRGVVLDTNDTRPGVGIRISHGKFNNKVAGDMDWKTMSFNFDVPEDQTEVEIICELRAMSGEVWFDLESLKIVRRPPQQQPKPQQQSP